MHGGIRVLHVDDDPDFADLVTAFLEREDGRLTVETANTVDEGLGVLDDDVDCVVSDYDMPGTNGIEFLQAVRDDYPDLPFVLFTGKGSEEIASEAISAGVTDYLQKESGTGQYAVLANRIANAVEQYRHERELEASRKRLSTFFEHSPLGVVEWNAEFEAVRANETAQALFGYADDEFAGLDWATLTAESDREKLSSLQSRLLETDDGSQCVLDNRTVEGATITCEWHNHVITDATGTVLAVFSQVRDVTAERLRRRRHRRQRQALTALMTDDAVVRGDFEAAVERITETAASVVDVPRVNVWMLDGDGVLRCIDHYDRETDAHASGARLSGDDFPAYFDALETHWAIDADDARTDPRTAELTADYLDVHDVGALLDGTLRSDGEFVGVICHEHVGGTREWTDDEIQFAGDVADVLHRALRNRERKTWERELKAEQRFVEQALDALDDVFYVVDSDGSLRRWNDRFSEVTGYSDAEIADMDATDFFPEAERERIAASIADTCAAGATTVVSELLTADGERIRYELSRSRLTDVDGEVIGLVGVGRRLDDRHDAE